MNKRNGKKHTPSGRIWLSAAAVLLSFTMLEGCSGRKALKASDYVTVSCYGLEAGGSVALSFDEEQLIQDLMTEKTLTDQQQQEMKELLAGAEDSFIISKASELSNGESIEIKGNFEKGLLKAYGANLENDTMKAEVSGLLGPVEISLSDYVEGSFEGFDGDGSASLQVNKEALKEALMARAAEVNPYEDPEEAAAALDKVLEAMEVEPTAVEGLSNGGSAEGKVVPGASGIDEYGILFTGESAAVEVNGLIPTEEVDISEYLLVSFSGFDGEGVASMDFDRDMLAADLAVLFEEDGRGARGALPQGGDPAAEAEEAASAVLDYWTASFSRELAPADQLSSGDAVEADSAYTGEGTAYLADYGLFLTDGSATVEATGLVPTPVISLSDYILPSFFGYEGYGSAEAALNTPLLAQDLASLLEELNRSAGGYAAEDTDFQAEGARAAEELAALFEAGFRFELPEPLTLSTGDTVAIRAAYAEDGRENPLYASSIGMYLEAGETEAAVAGLKALGELDASEFVWLETSGFDGSGTAIPRLDAEALTRAAAEMAAALDTDGSLGLTEASDALPAMEALAEMIAVDDAPRTELFNGSPVSAAVTIVENADTERFVRDYGIVLKGGQFEGETAGLCPVLTVALADYYVPSYSGYDTLGSSAWDFDADRLEADLRLAMQENGRGLTGLAGGSRAEGVAADSGAEGSVESAADASESSAADNSDDTAVDNVAPKDIAAAAKTLCDEIMAAALERGSFSVNKSSSLTNGLRTQAVFTLEPAEETLPAMTRYLAHRAADGDAALQKLEDVGILYLEDKGVLVEGFREIAVVDGLTELTPLDLSEAVSVEITGVCPDLTAVITLAAPDAPYLEYTDLEEVSTREFTGENGTVFNGAVVYNDPALRGIGYKVINASYEAVVEGLDSYLFRLTGPEDARLETMIEEGSLRAQKGAWELWKEMAGSGAEASGQYLPNQAGAELLAVEAAAGQQDGKTGNALYLLYKTAFPVRSVKQPGQETVVYFVTWTGDVRETPEGVLTAHHFWKGKSFFSQEEAEQFIRKDITGQFGESAESLME